MRVDTFRGGQLKYYIKFWEALTSDSEILSTIQGDIIEFDSCPPGRAFVYNPKIVDPYRQMLTMEIDILLSRGVLIHSQSEHHEFLSPIFTVPKSERDVRMILNLKDLNQYITYRHFKLDNITTILLNITQDCFMASFDLKSAYYSVPIRIDFQKYLQFRWEDTLYQFTCYPNGLAPCPRKFTKINKVPLTHLRMNNSIISGYIDDFFLQGQSYSTCEDTVFQAITLFDKLGFVIHPDKSSLIPKQDTLFGFPYRLPPSK